MRQNKGQIQQIHSSQIVQKSVLFRNRLKQYTQHYNRLIPEIAVLCLLSQPIKIQNSVKPRMKIVLNRQKLHMEMNQSLQRKYEDSFHFFQVKWVNELLDGSHHSAHFQNYVDMRIDLDNNEFLKRFYYFKTPTGKVEIDNRIKICCDFYASNVPNLYQYPMMIVTNTKSLFMRRAKRMKKIHAEVGSSDQTEQHLDQNQFFQANTSNFLSELSNSNIQQEGSFDNSSLSYDQSFHQIFQRSIEEKERQLIKLCKLEDVNESEVVHLIIQTGLSSAQLRLQIQNPSKQALNSIQNQTKSTKQSGISIIPIEERNSIRPKQKKSGVLSSYLDLMLDKQIGFNNIGLKFQNPAVTQYNSIHSANQLRNQSKSIERQRQQRASRRQKIRQKAQQLLKRARKDEQIEQRY